MGIAGGPLARQVQVAVTPRNAYQNTRSYM